MKLLIDMNLSPLWVRFFADRGIASTHWSAVGRPSATDSEILEHAGNNGFVIFTHDLDFGALLAKRHVEQPSVIQVRTQDVLPASIGDLVMEAIHDSHSYLEAGALVTVEPKRCRIRLPVRRD